MQNRKWNLTPVAMSNTLTTNILNPGTGAQSTPPVGFTANNQYILVNNIHVVNKTAGAVTFSLWKGASAGNVAGTELFNGQSVAANSVYDWNGPAIRVDAADFIVGGASAATSLTITMAGEIGVAG
jgi:hypothetical protein